MTIAVSSFAVGFVIGLLVGGIIVFIALLLYLRWTINAGTNK